MRTGRPRLTNGRKRSAQVGVRFTESEFAQLKVDANASGMRVTDLVRRRATMGYLVGWGSTRQVFHKQPDGLWLCKKTGEVKTDKEMNRGNGTWDKLTILPT